MPVDVASQTPEMQPILSSTTIIVIFVVFLVYNLGWAIFRGIMVELDIRKGYPARETSKRYRSLIHLLIVLHKEKRGKLKRMEPEPQPVPKQKETVETTSHTSHTVYHIYQRRPRKYE